MDWDCSGAMLCHAVWWRSRRKGPLLSFCVYLTYLAGEYLEGLSECAGVGLGGPDLLAVVQILQPQLQVAPGWVGEIKFGFGGLVTSWSWF